MAKRGRRKSQFSLTTGSDPSLWRYENVGDALAANRDVLSQLIFAGTAQSPCTEEELEVTELNEKASIKES